MPRRIDVELTSARDDGTWTWRAAGARQPKGVVATSLLYPDAKVGDVVAAEADFDIDGITITSVTPPKAKAGRTGLLEVASGDDDFQPVITNWKERAGGRDRDPYGERSGGADGRGGRGGPGGPGGGGGRGGPGGDRGGNRGGPRPTADWRAKVAPPPSAGGERGERGGDRGGRGGGAGRDRDRGGRPRQDAGLGTGGPTNDRRGGQRPAREGAAPRRDRPDRGPGGGGGGGEGGAPAKPRPKRLSPANTHRTAVLESLSPEQRPVAEQVLRGGIPAVRRAIEEQNKTAKDAGQPEIKPGPLVALAEELLPKLKTAEWRDRAEAAMADVDEIGLRDLRSVVSGADAAARDDDTRTLASSLREALDRRVKKQQDDWIGEITSALDDNRLVRALRVASRPPDPSMRFPSDLAQRLAGTASEAMAADTPPERWAALLEAVAASPVRTTVKPAALPENPGEALLNAARQQAGRIPALTILLGISMPPPPGPVRRIPPKPTQGAKRPIPPPPTAAPPAEVSAAAAPAPAEVSAAASNPNSAAEAPVAPAPVVEASAAAEPPAEAPVAPAPVVEASAAGAEPPAETDQSPAPVVEASAAAEPPAETDPVALEPVVEASAAAEPPAETDPSPAPVVEASAAAEPPAETDPSPAPPTPLHDEPPADAATPPEASEPVAPSDPSPTT